MTGSLTIGDFSRVTFLSVKTLRHYHRVGLLEPADVDPVTGYRRYTSVQIPIAQVIRRFRDLDMPLDDIGSVLRARDQTTRSQLIVFKIGYFRVSLESAAHSWITISHGATKPRRRRRCCRGATSDRRTATGGHAASQAGGRIGQDREAPGSKSHVIDGGLNMPAVEDLAGMFVRTLRTAARLAIGTLPTKLRYEVRLALAASAGSNE